MRIRIFEFHSSLQGLRRLGELTRVRLPELTHPMLAPLENIRAHATDRPAVAAIADGMIGALCTAGGQPMGAFGGFLCAGRSVWS